jgi:CheY-like chemotaxis protein
MNEDKYVLLVEDDLDINEAIQTVLEDSCYKVKCTFNGKDALDFLNTTENFPSLILVDNLMPQMTGAAFRVLQLQDPRIATIPTVLMSASGHLENISQLNFKQILKKPLEIESLIDIFKINIT